MLNVYAIKDDKSGVYSHPILTRTLPELMRAIINALRDKKQDFAQFPADFSVWSLGKYDETLGAFIELEHSHAFNILDLVDKTVIEKPLADALERAKGAHNVNA